jgi:hypothetical protein
MAMSEGTKAVRQAVRQMTDEVILRCYHVSAPTRGLVKGARMLAYTRGAETVTDTGGYLYPALNSSGG